MGKKAGNANYNYNSCLKPARLARINKPDKIKYCQECEVNSHPVLAVVGVPGKESCMCTQ